MRSKTSVPLLQGSWVKNVLIQCTDLISLARPASITTVTSSMVMEDSATLVAMTIFLIPFGAGANTLAWTHTLCSFKSPLFSHHMQSMQQNIRHHQCHGEIAKGRSVRICMVSHQPPFGHESLCKGTGGCCKVLSAGLWCSQMTMTNI